MQAIFAIDVFLHHCSVDLSLTVAKLKNPVYFVF